jgi:UDP-glucose 4,6-dehydratase
MRKTCVDLKHWETLIRKTIARRKMTAPYIPQNVLVTGGAGFIGSGYLNHMVAKYPQINFVNLDRLDYCASLKNVTVADAANYKFVHGDIGSLDLVMHILDTHKIDGIVSFAAQSSVDHSNNNAEQHVRDNVLAVQQLLEACRKYGKLQRIIMVSTDECYGDQVDGTAVHEDSLLMPNNVYSASKAAGEMIVRAYRVSYKLPIIVTRGNNCFGERQYCEKIWPKFISQLLKGEKMTIHGRGETRRNFLHVNDTVKAFDLILFQGKIGEIYNIGTSNELSVLEVAELLRSKICPYKTLDEVTTYVRDRDFNDARYVITSNKLRALGWKEEEGFNCSVDRMIEWYRMHGETQWV